MASLLRSSLLCALAVSLVGCSSSTTGSDARGAIRDLPQASCGTGDAGPSDWRVQSLNYEAGVPTFNPGSGLPANLSAVWGASGAAVWAVGSEGKVLYFDGQGWTVQTTPTKQNLTAVWGSGPKDVWAAGWNGTVIRFNGTTWVDASPPDLVFVPAGQDGGPPKGDAAVGFRRIIWGLWGFGSATSGTTELFAVGERGLILRWSNNAWNAIVARVSSDPLSSAIQDRLNGVWGSGGTIHVVGEFGTYLTGSGTGGITAGNALTSKALLTVWGRGGDIYLGGQNGTLLHKEGGSWKEINGLPKQVLRGIWGPASNSSRLYVVGIDGTLLRMSGGPAFASPKVELFACVTKNRLDGIWGFEMPMAPTPDAGAKMEEHIWAVGVSGTIVLGP